MEDERLQILRMVEQGQISAVDALMLLNALESGQSRPESMTKARWFRVRVTDQRTGRRKVNVNIPLALAEVGARLGLRFGGWAGPELDNLDLDHILDMIRQGAQGKIVEVEDRDSGELVEVYVE
jgi:hypothetical protein